VVTLKPWFLACLTHSLQQPQVGVLCTSKRLLLEFTLTSLSAANNGVANSKIKDNWILFMALF
jgi:hypothetical protein